MNPELRSKILDTLYSYSSDIHLIISNSDNPAILQQCKSQLDGISSIFSDLKSIEQHKLIKEGAV